MSLLSKEDAARELGIGLRTLERLLAEGELTPVRIRGRVLVEPDELARFVRQSRGAAAPAPEAIAAKQRARFYAQCDKLDALTKARAGTSKASMKAWASDQFGREVESVNHLTYDEASDVLDELRARVEDHTP
jgi:excisionase family DNA binding protein